MSNADKWDPQDRGGGRDPEESKVIVIGWQAIVLPLVVIAVVAAGFYFGRAMSGASQPASPLAPAMPTSSLSSLSAASASQSGNPYGADLGGGTIQLQESALSRGYPEDMVVDLPPPSHPLMGQPAPDFSMPLLGSDEQVSLSGLAGQHVVVNFWATWCPPCRHEMPWLENVYERYADQGLVVLGLNAGERVSEDSAAETVQAFVQMMGLTFPVVLGQLNDSIQLQREYSVLGLPATYFIDPSGTVVDLHTGMFPNEVTFEAKVKKLLGLTDTPTEQP